jgi:hypothetical protein
MTIQGTQPHVEDRLNALKDANSPPIDHVIAAFMAGARDNEAGDLARQVLDEHREFFDLIGDR